MDVSCTEGDRIIELGAPEDIHDISDPLKDNQRFITEAICSLNNWEIPITVRTTWLQKVGGKYMGKDCSEMFVRGYGTFPTNS
jgi:fructose 1,6-bisphosphatase